MTIVDILDNDTEAGKKMCQGAVPDSRLSSAVHMLQRRC